MIIYFIYIGEIRASWLFLKFYLKLTSSLKRREERQQAELGRGENA